MPEKIMKILEQEVPIGMVSYDIVWPIDWACLVIVDPVKGFCKAGCGQLAPPVCDLVVNNMVFKINEVARNFVEKYYPIIIFTDCHDPDIPEPPYPEHCLKGTEEAEIVDGLDWLKNYENTVIIKKDCINGYVGATDTESGYNNFEHELSVNGISKVVVVGICTDICVMDLALTLLSARNHRLIPSLKDVVVYAKGCATYDLPVETAVSSGLTKFSAHPRELAQYMGLYFMAARGAILADNLNFS